MNHGLDLSPAQAPLNCFGTGIVSGDRLASRILARLRPRHFRKTEYNTRLREGDAYMTEAWELFQGCQPFLSYDQRRIIQDNFDGLRNERDRLEKFSDYGGSQKAENDAIARAAAFRESAGTVHAMVYNARASVNTPRGRTSGNKRVSVLSERHHSSARSTHTPLTRVSTQSTGEPLEMMQAHAGPVSWSPPHNALHLDLGARASPAHPPTMISTRTSSRPPSSILSLDMQLMQFNSPARTSPLAVSMGYGSSPTDSVSAYSLNSDGFPRPSRRTNERRSTIQTTTSSVTKSSHASRQSGQLSRSGTYSSHARQSLERSGRQRSGSGSYRSQSQSNRRPASQDGQRPYIYTRTPTSLRNPSVPVSIDVLPGPPRY